MKYLAIYYFSLLIFTPCPAYCIAPVVEIEWSHRQVAHLEVDPAIPEGSLFVTFTSNQEITPIDPPSGLESINSNTWRLNLPWDNLGSHNLKFSNSSAETTQITASYTPLMPLDPFLHNMPVLSVITNPANLWDPVSGLYVFGQNDNCLQYGDDWEKTAIFQYFQSSSAPIFSEEVGIRINGGWSRRLKQKGLRFYFDDYGNTDSIEYDFFDSSPTSFKRLVLKSGYSPSRCINSMFAESIMLELGHLCSRTQIVSLYLNNEYWGFQTLKERIDDKFIEHTHELGQDGFNLIKDGEVQEGTGESWWNFLDSFQMENDYASHQWFNYATATLDLEPYIDWLLINIFGATADNGGPGNLALLQLGSGPWQFIMHDEDDLFTTGNLNANFFRFFSIATEDEFDEFRPPVLYSGSANDRIRWAAPFRSLMQNSEFKILFKNRLEELMATKLSDSDLQVRLNGISTAQGPEMARHSERWDTWSDFYDYAVNATSTWFTQRGPIVLSQFESFLESYRVPVELSTFGKVDLGNGTTQITWRTESEENCLGFVLFAGNNPDNLTIIASYETDENLLAHGNIWQAENYEYSSDTGLPGMNKFHQLAWVDLSGETHLIPWLLTTHNIPNLKINEFIARNINGIEDETGTPEDWVEIFNAGTEMINLEGMYLTDDLSDTQKWECPSITLEAGAFLLVWCDSDPEDGPLHTNFKLSASGEDIAIFDSQNGDNQLIDSYTFGLQANDVSEGRSPDGHTQWINFPVPTPGESNVSISGTTAQLPQSFELGPNHPNPFNPTTTIFFNIKQSATVSIDVYDINGRKIRTLIDSQVHTPGKHQTVWNGCDNQGRSISSGTYFARARIGNEHRVLKLSLIK